METPHLVELIDAHKRAYGVSESELARQIGITRQNMHLWRTHGVRGLPARTTLEGIAAELRLPYVRVLEATLRDVDSSTPPTTLSPPIKTRHPKIHPARGGGSIDKGADRHR